MKSIAEEDADIWKDIYEFTDEGTQSVNLIFDREYKVVASAVGVWVILDQVVTKNVDLYKR